MSESELRMEEGIAFQIVGRPITLQNELRPNDKLAREARRLA